MCEQWFSSRTTSKFESDGSRNCFWFLVLLDRNTLCMVGALWSTCALVCVESVDKQASRLRFGRAVLPGRFPSCALVISARIRVYN